VDMQRKAEASRTESEQADAAPAPVAPAAPLFKP
jgi:hypothetical protein